MQLFELVFVEDHRAVEVVEQRVNAEQKNRFDKNRIRFNSTTAYLNLGGNDLERLLPRRIFLNMIWHLAE